MMDKVLPILALAALGVFLGIMVWFVPRLDLGIVIALCYAFAVIDFAKGMLSKE